MVGAYMVLYSLWMLKEWKFDTVSTSDSAITTVLSDGLPLLGEGNLNTLGNVGYQELGRPFISIGKQSLLTLPDLPAPWFIYAFLGSGIITCFVALIGHIAAETSHGFCLSCYTFLQVVLLIVQFAIAGYIFFDRHWREDIPEDPTGELDKLEKFVKKNLDICKWAALAVVVMEALGLFFAMTLRAVSVTSRRRGYDSDDDYTASRNARQPINRQADQANNPAAVGAPPTNRQVRNDAWSTRMREKYGLDTTEFTYNPSESRRFAQQNQAPIVEDKPNWCTIM